MFNRPKYFETRAAKRVFPRLLIFKEKHDNAYYHCASNKDVYEACLTVLAYRYKEGWYGQSNDYNAHLPALESAVANAVQNLEKVQSVVTDLKVLNPLKAAVARAKSELQEVTDAKETLDRIALALETNDGELAYDCLDRRSDHEYEGFRLETYNAPKITL